VNIAAIDLSLTRTGWALTRGGRRHYGSIIPKSTGMPRIDHIMDALETLLHPESGGGLDTELVVLEGPALHAQGRGVCDRWALRGVVLYHLHMSGVPFVEIPPASMKKFATGNGNANKDAMVAAAIRHFDYPGENNDEADSWIALAMAEAHYGHLPLSAYRTAALAKVTWPVLATGGVGG
jgi:crossover junction endodeoxyribonuclease RuvC